MADFDYAKNTTNAYHSKEFEDYDSGEYDKYFVIFLSLLVVSIVLVLLGIVANCIVCGVLLRNKRLLKNFSNFHLFNLAVTDIFFRVVVTPTTLVVENTVAEHGNNAVCKLSVFGSLTTLAVTFVLLLGIAFDRYVHIVHPLRARNITWRHSRNTVVISWLYAAACSSPALFSVEYVKINGNSTDAKTDAKYEICVPISGLPFQVSSTIYIVFAFLVPLVLMAVAYGAILRVLWLRSQSKVINSRVTAAKFRAVKMMLIIVAAYLISWGPFLAWIWLQAYEVVSLENPYTIENEQSSRKEYLENEKKFLRLLMIDDAMYLLTFTSSVLNPVIFGYYSSSFRNDLKKCCCEKTCSTCCKTKSNQYHKEDGRKELRSLVDATTTTDLNLTTKL